MVKLTPYPEEGELVICTVRDVKGFGAFVLLTEYNNREGFIHVAEVATGWVKYIRDHVREGQKIVCKVLRVDPVKEHIDLSLKQVNEHAKKDKIQEWKNEQRAEKLFEIVSQNMKKPLEECYTEFGNALVEKFGTLYSSFEETALDPKVLEREGLKGPWTKAFVGVARENIIPPQVMVHGYLELTCGGKDGVRKIRDALLKANEAKGTNAVEIQYLGAPRYRIEVRALDYRAAEEQLKNAVDVALAQIKDSGGKGSFVREKGGSCAHS
jgi:translation initiation factor 2 subunit 1